MWLPCLRYHLSATEAALSEGLRSDQVWPPLVTHRRTWLHANTVRVYEYLTIVAYTCSNCGALDLCAAQLLSCTYVTAVTMPDVRHCNLDGTISIVVLVLA